MVRSPFVGLEVEMISRAKAQTRASTIEEGDAVERHHQSDATITRGNSYLLPAAGMKTVAAILSSWDFNNIREYLVHGKHR